MKKIDMLSAKLQKFASSGEIVAKSKILEAVVRRNYGCKDGIVFDKRYVRYDKIYRIE